MKSSLLVAFALSVYLFEVSKEYDGHNHKRSSVGKLSKHKVKERHSGAKYVIETLDRHHKDGRKKKRRDKILQIAKGAGDYSGEDKCSLANIGKPRKMQLEIPGCGGWVRLDCRGGCLAIDKV